MKLFYKNYSGILKVTLLLVDIVLLIFKLKIKSIMNITLGSTIKSSLTS